MSKRPTISDATHDRLVRAADLFSMSLDGMIGMMITLTCDRFGLSPLNFVAGSDHDPIRSRSDPDQILPRHETIRFGSDPATARNDPNRIGSGSDPDTTNPESVANRIGSRSDPDRIVPSPNIMNVPARAPACSLDLDPRSNTQDLNAGARAPLSDLLGRWNRIAKDSEILTEVGIASPKLTNQLTIAWSECADLDAWDRAFEAAAKLPRYAVEQTGLSSMSRLLSCPSGKTPPDRFLWAVMDGAYANWVGPRASKVVDPPPGSRHGEAPDDDAAFFTARMYGQSLGVRVYWGDDGRVVADGDDLHIRATATEVRDRLADLVNQRS